ncbi:MAG: OmpH family outer membrane protein [Saprospiraceae bacterium]|nr:OmpH family outer membrane protein [Saprospiraceae bacterium]
MMRSLFIVSMVLSSCLLFGQKYGHINSRNLLDTLNETKIIAAELSTYEKALTETGEKMVLKFQTNLEAYRTEVAAGNLTAIRRKQLESELEVEQDAIGKYQQSAKESLEKRRNDLLNPLLAKIDLAIDQIAKEGGYNMIFDSSVSMLFVTDAFDISAMVISKLNTPK